MITTETRGRKKKYGEKMRHIGLNIPDSAFNQLEIEAAGAGKSMSELVIYSIIAADPELRRGLAETNNELRKLLTEAIKTNTDLGGKLERFGNRHVKRIIIYATIEADETVKQVVGEFGPEFKQELEKLAKVDRENPGRSGRIIKTPTTDLKERFIDRAVTRLVGRATQDGKQLINQKVVREMLRGEFEKVEGVA